MLVSHLALFLPTEFSGADVGSFPDFNADGYADLAIGSPSEDIGTSSDDAGAVNVIYGFASGLSATSKVDQVWSQASGGVNDEPQSGDLFGSSLAAGDFNGDGYSDLAIGIPGEDNNAGATAVIYGSSAGLKSSAAGDGTGRSDQLWRQSSSGIDDSVEVGDSFGQALASGNFNGDSYDDLAIGVPGESVSGSTAGAVAVIYGSSSGLSASAIRVDQLVTQVGSDKESGDLFGWSLMAGDFNNDGRDDIAVGAPAEDAGGADAGAVHVLLGSSAGLVTDGALRVILVQGAGGVEDASEAGDEFGHSLAAGDFNGDEFDDLAIGAPFQDVASAGDNAGAVNVIYGSSAGLSASAAGDGTGRDDQYWHQFDPSETLASSQSDIVIQHPAAQRDDMYGYSLAAGDFNNDGSADLAIGVPGESVAGVLEAGSVNMLYGSAGGLQDESPHDQVWHQNTSSVRDSVEEEDRFANALSSADYNSDGYDDLAIGVAQEDISSSTGTKIDAGAVNVLYGSPTTLRSTASGTTPDDQFWSQNSPGVNDSAESGDSLGVSLS